MKHQDLQIGQPLKCEVVWYDQVPVPPRNIVHDGEVIGWRDSQLIVRVKDYAVIRFWKRNGLEVGNPDHVRRGFRVDISALNNSTRPAPGPAGIPIAIDTDA